MVGFSYATEEKIFNTFGITNNTITFHEISLRMLMWHVSEKQHIAIPEPLPGPGPHILYGHLCWLPAQEVHYMIAFKVAITVTPDSAKAVWEQSPCIKCFTQLLRSVPPKKRLGSLPKALQVQLLYSMRSKDPKISRLLKWTVGGQHYKTWRLENCSGKWSLWEGWLNITHQVCNMRVGGEYGAYAAVCIFECSYYKPWITSSYTPW